MKIAIISTSTRTGRQSHKVALGLELMLSKIENIIPELIDLKAINLPVFEEIMEKASTNKNEIQKLHSQLNAVDAFIVVTPEYNGNYSSAFQNMVDHYPKSTFAKKAVGIVTVTTGTQGGMRAALHLQQFILAFGAIPCPQMLLVPTVQNKFDEFGNLLDENFIKTIQTFLTDFNWLAKALKDAK
jgi:NAD(P)H-dependent FMN reductase